MPQKTNFTLFSIRSLPFSSATVLSCSKAKNYFINKILHKKGENALLCSDGTPTKRQVSKQLVSKRPVSKRQVYKTLGLQNIRFQNVWFQNV
jgi:hypothetical protein